MSATELLAPIVEEIANRWGFFRLKNRGSHLPLTINVESLEGLSFYGASLNLTDVAEHLGLQGGNGELEFPLSVPSSELPQWRAKTRQFFELLSQENPRQLGRVEARRWTKPRTPQGELSEVLDCSAAFLERTYRGEFLVREKKPIVADYRRCHRNYLSSVDSDGGIPKMLLMDASSQIASHLLGFNGTPLKGVVQHPESFQNPDYRYQEVPAEEALRFTLKRWAPDALKYVAWCNSGAESWEKAFHLASLKFPDRGPKCVCFKGSFHGRTLLSLFSSWNPVKREPFQLEGFETLWAEFPEDKEPHFEKRATEEWLEIWENSYSREFIPPKVDSERDPLLHAEVQSLIQVRDYLRTGQVCAVSIEPMQCEGGDRYASHRFFQTLRVLTHALGVALILDEVQTGFGLGGPPLWSTLFDLQDSDEDPLPPDFIVLAKKCQVGAVLSSIEDPYPTSAHAASFMRGYANAASISEPLITELGDSVRERLFELAVDYDQLQNPRAQGLAFAFDLPSKRHAMNFVNQRFYRGIMVYIAGEQTLRFRIQRATTEADLDIIFAAITDSLQHLAVVGPDVLPTIPDNAWSAEEGPGHPVPLDIKGLGQADWTTILRFYGELEPERYAELAAMFEGRPIERFGELHRQRKLTWLEFLRFVASNQAVRIVALNSENWPDYKDSIMELERRVYEPARVDTEEFLQGAVEADRSVALVALTEDKLVGFCIGAPLENFGQVRGPDNDPEMGKNTLLYSADLLVDPHAQGQGIGLRLKRRQTQLARALGYQGIRSRNRVGAADSMRQINRSFGGAERAYFEKEYGEDGAPCVYLGTPLMAEAEAKLVWSSGVENPTGGMLSAESWKDWDLAAVNKNSLCNWWTPNMTRYVEWLRAVAPLSHLYLASGRDEAVDKLIKCLIHHRKGAQKMLTFEGSFWGGVTAAARSLSDASFGGYFPWERIPYPHSAGDPFEDEDEALTDPEMEAFVRLSELLSDSSDSYLGLAVEPIQQMTGRRLSVRFLHALRSLCDDNGVPLVMNESAAWAYRGSRDLFYCQATGVRPDLMTFFAGGQLGHVLVSDKYFIEKPLQLISTWDGDELSCLRLREQLRVLKTFRDSPRLHQLDLLIGDRGDTYRGSGLLYDRHPGLAAASTIDKKGQLLFPPLNRLEEGWSSLVKALPRQLQQV